MARKYTNSLQIRLSSFRKNNGIMKQISFIAFLAVGAVLATATTSSAQVKTDFAGKWRIVVYGTPQGDAPMIFQLDRKDGKLGGIVKDSTDKEMTKITSVEETDSTVNVFFTTQGYDVNVLMQPTVADSVKGNLMGMFEVKGARLKEKK